MIPPAHGTHLKGKEVGVETYSVIVVVTYFVGTMKKASRDLLRRSQVL